jgi:L-asparagine transporter-like permease
MQFWDTVFWLNDSNTVINQYSTKAAMLWNHFEPIVLFLLIWIINGKVKTPSFIFISLYMVSCVIYSSVIFSKLGGTKQTEKSGESLDWEWNHFEYAEIFYLIFLATLVVLFYFEFDGWVRIVSIFLTIISFFFSVYKYRMNMIVGRIWCYITAFLPLIYLMKLIYKND